MIRSTAQEVAHYAYLVLIGAGTGLAVGTVIYFVLRGF
jgi:glucokinase